MSSAQLVQLQARLSEQERADTAEHQVMHLLDVLERTQCRCSYRGDLLLKRCERCWTLLEAARPA